MVNGRRQAELTWGTQTLSDYHRGLPCLQPRERSFRQAAAKLIPVHCPVGFFPVCSAVGKPRLREAALT